MNIENTLPYTPILFLPLNSCKIINQLIILKVSSCIKLTIISNLLIFRVKWNHAFWCFINVSFLLESKSYLHDYVRLRLLLWTRGTGVGWVYRRNQNYLDGLTWEFSSRNQAGNHCRAQACIFSFTFTYNTSLAHTCAHMHTW